MGVTVRSCTHEISVRDESDDTVREYFERNNTVREYFERDTCDRAHACTPYLVCVCVCCTVRYRLEPHTLF